MKRSTRAGLSASSVIAVLLTAGCSSVSNPIAPRQHFTADFLSVAGVFEGNPVTVLGLDVGRVDKIVPKGPYVEVHMSVDHDVEIPKNVQAAIISPSIVTDRHIELTPRYTGGETLGEDAHLTVTQTRTPVELDTMLKTIDAFAAALKPQEGQEGLGPLSGRVLYPMLNGNGEKMRETLNALSGALKLGLDNKDAVSTIIVKLNDLTTMLAENDQSVRDFSDKMTQMSGLLAEQAPGLQATLDQLNAFLANTSGVFSQHSDQLNATLTGLTTVTNQLRANAAGLIEVVDVAPMLLDSIDRSVNREGRYLRSHLVLGASLSGEIVSLFCERIQMKSDGCRTGRIEDFGPDFGLMAALLGLTK
ncbi:MCE family protein [Nocardia cyriacigeorgica]|uniref:MCE family protein n=1 Tax=Nocardia cyriacigeorgica TaxID=135487 RepID=A0A6P1D541_9NOCA|nr:MCE family protein [Nocardia cyriacigeorgica]NEW37710.1 MCE family protein [Nocardia cyriacigeorgica]NEW43302.1 MCE family protein [Nocardia cyriacigeorgica]NEW48904.1 MCE family protein [Nocardia cyriacigeorgica]NEW55005.1 MCE family protein [Nocardia cyriacigeorgica]